MALQPADQLRTNCGPVSHWLAMQPSANSFRWIDHEEPESRGPSCTSEQLKTELDEYGFVVM